MSEPRSWLEIVADIDGLMWQAGEIDKARAQRSPINQMIDQAAGVDATEDAEFKAAMEALNAELRALENNEPAGGYMQPDDTEISYTLDVTGQDGAAQ